MNNPSEHPSEEVPATNSIFELVAQLPTLPHMNGSALAQTLGCYWHLFNDLGLSSLRVEVG